MIQTTELAILQLDDARRGCLVAASALRCVAGDATDAVLQADVQRIQGALCSAADELAELKQRARVSV